MKRPLTLLTVALLLPLAAAAQGTVTITNGTVALQNGCRLATTSHLTIAGTLTAAGGTTVAFNGAADQHLTPAAGQILADVTLDKASGDLVLMGDLDVTGTLALTGGDLDLNGFHVDLGTTGTLSETTGHTVKGIRGTIRATRTLNAPNGDDVAGLGAEITSNQDLGATTLTRGHAVQTGDGNQSIARYFDVAPANNSQLDARFVFRYDDAELNGLVEGDLVLFRSTDGGTTWTQEGGLVNPVANTISLSGVDAFSRWTASGAGLLPVELVSFEVQVDGADVLLRWETASETNNAGFEVQHGLGDDGGGGDHDTPLSWDVLTFVEGYGTTEVPQTYAYRVEALDPGPHAFRLKQIDYDGTFEYSPQVEVFVELAAAYVLTPPYPNPFAPEARFSLMVKRRQHVDVDVYDVLGRRVRVLYRGEMAAEQARLLVFASGDLPSGVYVIQAVGEAFAATRRVVLAR